MKISTKEMKDIADLTTLVKDSQETAEVALTVYNEGLAALKDYIERLRDEQQNEYDEKSEKWQESDRGQAAQEWIGVIENAMDALDEVDAPDFPDLSDVDALPSEPDGV